MGKKSNSQTSAVVMAGWTIGSFASGGITHPTYTRGTGPGVVVVHEVPGITPSVAKFANEVVDAGFTVVMPLLVGKAGPGPRVSYLGSSMLKVCVAKEFTTLAMNQTSPVIAWLRALAKQLHSQTGGVGVGAVGMCFSGGFALGMMLDEIMVAPVLSQPSLPFALGKSRPSNLGLSPDDQSAVVARAAAGCQVLGLRFKSDKLVGTRFETLHRLLGDAFISVEFASASKSDHSVLTEQRQQVGVDRVIDFLQQKLKNG